MDVHYHLWVRSGRIYSMRPKAFNTGIAAHQSGSRAGLPPDQRMVKKCTDCPESVRSKRPAQKRAMWSAFAAELGLPVKVVKTAAKNHNLPGAYS